MPPRAPTRQRACKRPLCGFSKVATKELSAPKVFARRGESNPFAERRDAPRAIHTRPACTHA
jgi:hypothetical protein